MGGGLIYLIWHKATGKVYIGKTTRTVLRRWTTHVSAAKRGEHSRFYNAVRKYGKDAFEIEVLDSAPDKITLDRMERGYIELYDSRDPRWGYNITVGGDGAGSGPDNPNYGKPGPNLGRKFPPEFGEHVSQGKQGIKVSEEARQNIIKGLMGRSPTETTRKRLAQGKRGALNPNWKKPHSVAWKEQNGRTFRDRVWVSYLGTPLEVKRVKSSDLQRYLEKGWVKGRWNRRAHTLLK